MLQFPIQTIKGNILYTRNEEAWAYYKIQENAAGVHDQEAENELVHSLERLAWQLGMFEEVDCKVIPVPVDLPARMDELIEQYEGPYEEIGTYYAERTKAILEEEVRNVVEYKFFMGIKLKGRELDEGILPSFSSSFKSMNRFIQKLAGFSDGQADSLMIQRFSESEDEAYSQLSQYLTVSRAEEKDIRFLIRQSFTRGQAGKVQEISLTSLTEGILDPSHPGYLKIEQLEQESWCAFLPVSEFPVDLVYTDWAHFFQAYSFPVELNLKMIYKDRKQNLNQTNRVKKRFRDQDAQLILANEDDDTLINRGRELLHELENQIKNENKPLLRIHLHFTVYGSSKEEVRKRARRLTADCRDQSIELVQPLADQLLLFHQSLPGAGLAASDWEQMMTPEAFGESLFTLSHKVGNTVGFYLGKNISQEGESLETSQSLVFYHPFLAHLGLKGSKYSSPHVTISGPTGMGKSYLLKDILLNSVFFGARVLMTDPKNGATRS